VSRTYKASPNKFHAKRSRIKKRKYTKAEKDKIMGEFQPIVTLLEQAFGLDGHIVLPDDTIVCCKHTEENENVNDRL
jgi:hypothetical protein